MSRIDSGKVSVGRSFVVETENDEAEDSLVNLEKVLAEKEIECIQMLENSKVEAQKIIENAKSQAVSEAASITEKLKKEAKDIGYRTGYDEGYQSGFKTGHNQAATETTAAIKQSFSEKLSLFNSFITSVFDIKKKVVKSLHVELTSLITELVDTVCMKKNALDNKIVAGVVQQAISKLQEKSDEDITLIVNPKMKHKILEVLDFVSTGSGMGSNVRLIEDRSLSLDGVIIESLQERIDATFSSHLKNIVNSIMEESDSFSEDNLVLEYEDSFSELKFQESRIIDAATDFMDDLVIPSNIVIETPFLPENLHLDEVMPAALEPEVQEPESPAAVNFVAEIDTPVFESVEAPVNDSGEVFGGLESTLSEETAQSDSNVEDDFAFGQEFETIDYGDLTNNVVAEPFNSDKNFEDNNLITDITMQETGPDENT